jgi:hypothetical protein
MKGGYNLMKPDRQFRPSIVKNFRKPLAGVLFSLFIVFLFIGTGCTKQRAGLNITKAKKLMLEAEKREAQRLEPDNYEKTRKLIEEADRYLSEKNNKKALKFAGDAVTSAKTVLEESRKKLAAQRLNEAQSALGVADRNNGVQQDPERYNKIKELYNKAQEKQSKNKWDDVISICNEQVEEVKILLSRLENDAKQKQAKAIQKASEMDTAGANDYAPNYIITVRDMLRTIEKNINEDRDYQGARNLADEAIRQCEEGIIATKRKMAAEQQSRIEEGLADATEKGADIYARELLATCNNTFDTIVTQFIEQKYDKVLESAKYLYPKVEKLIYTTRKKSADAKINTLVKEIDGLEEGGAKQYLPGRVEIVEGNLANARSKFSQELFEDAESECNLGFNEAEQINAAFNDLALDAMRNAAEALGVSRNVFDKMSEIFIINPSRRMSKINLNFEHSKIAMQTELDRILKNARLTLGIARNRQEENKYRKAIEMSGEVKQSSEYVLNETYHVVAHNSIMELSEQITIRETDGAREYASTDLDRTKKLLNQAKEELANAEYKESVRKAAETRAQLELTIQEVAQAAVENMKTARKEISDAPNYKTSEFQNSELERAKRLLSEADASLKSQKLKPAVDIALEAALVARKASKESARQWCEQVLKDAADAISKAEDAGALIYAAEQIDEAKRFFSTAENLYKSEDYMKGNSVAQRATQKAREALYKNVITAETAINEAKSYDGWKYSYPLLSQAIVDAKLARQTIEKEDYISSTAYSEKATIEANKVVKESQKAAFKNRVKNISNQMDDAMHSGVNYFQTDKAKKVYRELADIQEDFSLDEYDYMISRLDKLDGEMEKVVSSTPEALDRFIDIQKMRLKAQKEMDAIDIASSLMKKAEDNLVYAKIDFNKKMYSRSYRNLKKAIECVDEIDRRISMERYINEACGIIEELSETMYQFQAILKLNPTLMELFTKGLTGEGQYISIASRMKPDEFRTSVTELYHKARLIEVPESASNVHKEFIDMMNDIRLASIYFDKLIILNEYEPGERRKIIIKAYDLIDKAQQKRSDIQKLYLNRARKVRL